MPGDAEGAGESAQTAALVVGAQYLFALLLAVSVSARLFTTALSAIAAQITLAAIRSEAVTHQPFALAMLTSQSNGDHDCTLARHLYVSHYQGEKAHVYRFRS